MLTALREKAHRKFSKALQDVSTFIDQIERQTPLLAPPERDPIVKDVLSHQNDRLKRFQEDIRGVSLPTDGIVGLDRFQSFWDELRVKPKVEEKEDNAFDPGDGLVYTKEELQEAMRTLQDFYKAWGEVYDASERQPPRLASDLIMAQACLILKGMRETHLIGYFHQGPNKSLSLPADMETIAALIQGCERHETLARRFVNEQYRVVRRDWGKGDHITGLPKEEPLPLRLDAQLGWGSFGNVHRYEDMDTSEEYAVKESKESKTKKHMLREIEALKLVQHRHVVRYEKSYERGHKIGIVLSPVATANLKELLYEHYQTMREAPQHQNPEFEELHPVILTTFGCLTSGLLHMHEKTEMRHRDIRIDNILYLAARTGEAGHARFLWADFGLAYYFGDKDGSKTHTPAKETYSARYRAPELLMRNRSAEDLSQVLDRKQNLKISHSEGDRSVTSETYTLSLQEDKEHGRSADVFSCGCVFLEIVSVLAGTGIPNFRNNLEFVFADNIERLQQWAATLPLPDGLEKPLRQVLTIASRMIMEDHTTRPTMYEVSNFFLNTEMATDFYCSPECRSDTQNDTHALKDKREQQAAIDVHETGTGIQAPSIAGPHDYTNTINQMKGEVVPADGVPTQRDLKPNGRVSPRSNRLLSVPAPLRRSKAVG